jgi:hypothetical protein
MGLKILICGDRNWTDIGSILLRMRTLPKDTIIINGAARGADQISTRVAKYLGLKYIEYPADWVTHGKAAGPVRNRQMLKEKPDEVWAFHHDIEHSKGTKDMVTIAEKARIPVRLFR